MRIDLPDDAREALGKVAVREHREPQAQATHIVVSCLRRRGLMDGERNDHKSDRVEERSAG